MNNDVYAVAAKWWADVLRAPKFDNGDNTPDGAMTKMLATISQNSPVYDKLKKFQGILESKLRGNPDILRFGLHVDYNPDQTLYDSATEAGIDNIGMTMFPWKTIMRLKDDGQLVVGYGYGAPFETIGTFPQMSTGEAPEGVGG